MQTYRRIFLAVIGNRLPAMNWAGDVMGLESMNLLRPLKVGPITLPNRVVMGSMHTGLEGHPERFDQLARFYAERAKGLVGLIVTGGFAPHFAGRVEEGRGRPR